MRNHKERLEKYLEVAEEPIKLSFKEERKYEGTWIPTLDGGLTVLGDKPIPHYGNYISLKLRDAKGYTKKFFEESEHAYESLYEDLKSLEVGLEEEGVTYKEDSSIRSLRNECKPKIYDKTLCGTAIGAGTVLAFIASWGFAIAYGYGVEAGTYFGISAAVEAVGGGIVGLKWGVDGKELVFSKFSNFLFLSLIEIMTRRREPNLR